MAVWIVALLLLAGAITLFWLRRSDRRESPHPPLSRSAPAGATPRLRPQLERLYNDGRYWGVRIEHGGAGNACEAALQCTGERYDFEEAPPLPLPGCAAMRCACHYVGLEEQRMPPPRRQVQDRRESIRYEPKRGARRQGKDRRRLNQWDDQSSL